MKPPDSDKTDRDIGAAIAQARRA